MSGTYWVLLGPRDADGNEVFGVTADESKIRDHLAGAYMADSGALLDPDRFSLIPTTDRMRWTLLVGPQMVPAYRAVWAKEL